MLRGIRRTAISNRNYTSLHSIEMKMEDMKNLWTFADYWFSTVIDFTRQQDENTA